MGSLLGALLAATGRRVVLLGRDPARAAALAASGLTLEGPGEEPPRTFAVEATADAGDVSPPPELVLLCVKAADTEAAVESIAPLPGEPTVAVVQNGLRRTDAVAEALGAPERVVGVLTTEGATRLEPGRVRHAGRGRTIVAPLVPEGLRRAHNLGRLLEAAGLEVLLEQDLSRCMWEKLVVNCAINALTALLGCRNGQLLVGPAAELGDRAAEEVAAVAAALGVAGDWRAEAARTRWRAVAEATAANFSSSLQDVSSGRKTEVFAINGAVAEVAREAGLSACVNKTLALLVGAREALAGGEASGPVQG